MSRTVTRRHLALLLVLPLVAAVAACTADPNPSPVKFAPGEFRLVAFDSCDQALAELRAAAKEVVTPWGLNSFGYPDVVMADAAEAATRGAPPPSTTDKTAYSGTNTHEAGVDEPDLVKTDGRRIVTLSAGVLSVVDAASRRLIGSVQVATEPFITNGEILLAGDHALVLLDPPYAFWDFDVRPGVVGPAPTDFRPTLLLVDIAGSPRVLSSARVDGSLIDARQVGATARVVIRSSPRIEFPAVSKPDTTDEARLAANRVAIDAAPIEAWLPRLEVTTAGASATAPVDCASVSRPAV